MVCFNDPEAGLALEVARYAATERLGGAKKLDEKFRASAEATLAELKVHVSDAVKAADTALRMMESCAWVPGWRFVSTSQDVVECSCLVQAPLKRLDPSRLSEADQEALATMLKSLKEIGPRLAKRWRLDTPKVWQESAEAAATVGRESLHQGNAIDAAAARASDASLTQGIITDVQRRTFAAQQPPSWVLAAQVPSKLPRGAAPSEVASHEAWKAWMKATHKIVLDRNSAMWILSGEEEARMEANKRCSGVVKRLEKRFAESSDLYELRSNLQAELERELSVWKQLTDKLLNVRRAHLDHFRARRYRDAEASLDTAAEIVNVEALPLLAKCQADCDAAEESLRQTSEEVKKMEAHFKQSLLFKEHAQALGALNQHEADVTRLEQLLRDLGNEEKSKLAQRDAKIKGCSKNEWERRKEEARIEWENVCAQLDDAEENLFYAHEQLKELKVRERQASQQLGRHRKERLAPLRQREEELQAQKEQLSQVLSAMRLKLDTFAKQEDARKAADTVLKERVLVRFVRGCRAMASSHDDHESGPGSKEEFYDDDEEEDKEEDGVEEESDTDEGADDDAGGQDSDDESAEEDLEGLDTADAAKARAQKKKRVKRLLNEEKERKKKAKEVGKGLIKPLRKAAGAAMNAISAASSALEGGVNSATGVLAQSKQAFLSRGTIKAEKPLACLELIVERKSPLRLAVERCDVRALAVLLDASSSDAGWHEEPEVRRALDHAWRELVGAAAEGTASDIKIWQQTLEMLWHAMPHGGVTQWAMGSLTVAEVDAQWAAFEMEKRKDSLPVMDDSSSAVQLLAAEQRARERRKPVRSDDDSVRAILEHLLKDAVAHPPSDVQSGEEGRAGARILERLRVRMSQCFGRECNELKAALARLAGERGGGSAVLSTSDQLHRLLTAATEVMPYELFTPPLLSALKLGAGAASIHLKSLRDLMVSSIVADAPSTSCSSVFDATDKSHELGVRALLRSQAHRCSLSPLHLAASVGDRDAVTKFLSAGYEALAPTHFTHVSPLAHAVYCGQESVLEPLACVNPSPVTSVAESKLALRRLLPTAAELCDLETVTSFAPVVHTLVRLGAEETVPAEQPAEQPKDFDEYELSALNRLVRRGASWVAWPPHAPLREGSVHGKAIASWTEASLRSSCLPD